LSGHLARLGVGCDASEAEVQRAFRALAKKYHPDKHSAPAAKARAERVFKDISESYRRVCDARGFRVPGACSSSSSSSSPTSTSTEWAQRAAAYDGYEYASATAESTRMTLVEIGRIFFVPVMLISGMGAWGSYLIANRKPPSGEVRAGSVTLFVPNSKTEQSQQPFIFNLQAPSSASNKDGSTDKHPSNAHAVDTSR